MEILKKFIKSFWKLLTEAWPKYFGVSTKFYVRNFLNSRIDSSFKNSLYSQANTNEQYPFSCFVNDSFEQSNVKL